MPDERDEKKKKDEKSLFTGFDESDYVPPAEEPPPPPAEPAEPAGPAEPTEPAAAEPTLEDEIRAKAAAERDAAAASPRSKMEPEDIGLPHITTEDEGLPEPGSFLGLGSPREAGEGAPPREAAARREEKPGWPEETPEAPWQGERRGAAPEEGAPVSSPAWAWLLLASGLLLLLGGAATAGYYYLYGADSVTAVGGTPYKTWLLGVPVAILGAILLVVHYLVKPVTGVEEGPEAEEEAAGPQVPLDEEEQAFVPLDERLQAALAPGFVVRALRVTSLLVVVAGVVYAGYYYYLSTLLGVKVATRAIGGTEYTASAVGGLLALLGFVLFLVVQSNISARMRTRAEVLLIVKEAELDRLRIERSKERRRMKKLQAKMKGPVEEEMEDAAET